MWAREGAGRVGKGTVCVKKGRVCVRDGVCLVVSEFDGEPHMRLAVRGVPKGALRTYSA